MRRLYQRSKGFQRWTGVLALVNLLIPLGTMPASASLMASNYVRMDVIDDWWVWKAADGMCGTEHTDGLGTTFSVAILSRAPDQIVFAVSNTSWRSMKIGQHYPFVLSMNGVAQRLDGIAINGAASANDPTLVTKTDLKAGLDNLSRLRPFSVAMGETPLVHNVRVPPRAVTWLIGCAAGSGDPFHSQQ